MHSFTAFAVIIASLAGLAVPQSIDPNSVPISTRQQWCNDQITSCPLICLQLPGNTAAPEANNCSATALTYSCVCSNGLQPNASQYSQTLPYFICTESNDQCVTNCNGGSSCQSACRTDHPCGAQDPVRVNTSTISTMSATATNNAASTTGAGGVVYTGFAGAAATTTAGSKSDANIATQPSETYGLALALAGFFGGLTFVL